jgi:hypothetical protein
MIRRAVNDDSGDLGESEPFPGIGGSSSAALLDQPPRENGSAKAAAGAVETSEALGQREREKLLQVSFGLPGLSQKVRRMSTKDGGERLKCVLIAPVGHLFVPPCLDLPAADGAKALEVMGFDLGEGMLGQLASRYCAEQLTGDVDVAQGFPSMEFRFSN